MLRGESPGNVCPALTELRPSPSQRLAESAAIVLVKLQASQLWNDAMNRPTRSNIARSFGQALSS